LPNKEPGARGAAEQLDSITPSVRMVGGGGSFLKEKTLWYRKVDKKMPAIVFHWCKSIEQTSGGKGQANNEFKEGTLASRQRALKRKRVKTSWGIQKERTKHQ